jgi:tRNA pseudouridine38-40 synthase
MPRFALTIEYDGRPYMGWQRQTHGPTVQQHIEQAFGRIVGTVPVIHCAGRTDAGVHALAMRAHVDLDTALTPHRLVGALNAHLRPEPISIIGCEVVDSEWHARFSSIGRTYEYRILNRRAPLTFERGLVWRVPQPLDAPAMQVAAQHLVGLHDFTTFRSAHCQANGPVRTLNRLDVVREGERISVHAQARSFLHHQVRSMVGCLALVGIGSWTPDDLKAALDARDRTALGLNAPPDGLYFVRADYPSDLEE